MHVGAAQFLEVDFLVRHGLHDVRARNEHVRDAAHHEDEIGDGGTVDRAAGARTEDRADLRHDARRERVAQEDVGVAAEGRDALLNPRAARVVQTHDGCAVLHGEIHHLADLFRVRLRQRAAEDGEVLREHVDEPPFHAAPTGHHAVAEDLLIGEPEIGGAVGDEAIELDERTGIEQHVEALARRHLPFLMLRGDALDAATLLRLRTFLLQQLQFVAHGHGAENLGPEMKRGQDNPAP